MKKIEHITKVGKLGMEIYVEDPINKGYTAYFVDFPIIVQGNSIEDAEENLWNAVYDILKSFTKQ